MSEQAQKLIKNRINLPWAKTKIFVLNLEQVQDDFIGHYEKGNEFGKFRVMSDKKVILEPSPEKFKDFEFYAAIWGKFDPYTLFLRNPVEVDSITFENISAIKNIYDERMRG